VGLGPAQTISGNGLNSFTLAGSTQLDSATPDASGIVVQAGDYICANSTDYDIGVDCNGSATPGDCPGPDFDTQYQTNLHSANEPMGLSDSNSDGVLMIRADLSKEEVVGTLGFFGFIGNLLKIAGFTLIGFSFAEYGLTMACMIPAAVIGTRAGRAVLSNLDERYFLIAFRVVLLILAVKLIAYDGLARFWS